MGRKGTTIAERGTSSTSSQGRRHHRRLLNIGSKVVFRIEKHKMMVVAGDCIGIQTYQTENYLCRRRPAPD